MALLSVGVVLVYKRASHNRRRKNADVFAEAVHQTAVFYNYNTHVKYSM